MEIHRPKQWNTRKGKAKFADKQLSKIRKKFEKDKSLSKSEKTTQLKIIRKCRQKIVKILDLKLKNEFPDKKLNIDYIVEFISIVPGYEQAAKILKEGNRITVSEKRIWETKLDFKNDHSCFQSPTAILNFLESTEDELKRGKLLGPFGADSTLFHGKPINRHRSGMAPKKGVEFKRLFRDFSISGHNGNYTDEDKKTELPQTTDMIRFLSGAVSFFLLDWQHAYRQLMNHLDEVRLQGYENFGMLFLDLFIPFGRADNAKIFQCVAETIIKAFRLRFPKIFTIDPDRLEKLKRFRYITTMESDL